MQTLIVARQFFTVRKTQHGATASSAMAGIFRDGLRRLLLPSRHALLSMLALIAGLGFVSANASAGQVSLAWDAVSGATGYRLYYGTASGSYAPPVDAQNATSYTVAGLTDGTRYYFAVRAYNATTTSGYSTELDTVVGSGTPPPPPPGGGGSGGSSSVKPGLVAAFGFEEASGTQVIDASGYGNHGTISNVTRVATTQFGRVLSFSGLNSSWVTVNDSASLDLSNGMTLEAWVYPTASMSGWDTVIMKEQTGGNAYALSANSDTNIPNTTVNVGGTDRQLRAGSYLPANQWSHVAATYNGSTQRLYVNGAQVGARSQTGAITLSNGALRIGGNSVWGSYFNGYIDEVRVYNRELSQAEISADSKAAVVGLVVSTSSSRSNSVPLNGVPVSGYIYASYKLISPTATSKPAKQVKFWLDDPNPNSPTGSPRFTDYGSPFDLAGTNSDGTAKAFSTSGLAKGVHTITAQVTLSDGTVLPYIKGTFTIQ
jgi:hypothetical protein